MLKQRYRTMKKRTAPSSTEAASNVLTRVRTAQLIEAVKIYVASASAVVHDQAQIIENRVTHVCDDPNLGACCRLVHWALVETSKALESEAIYACRASNDRHALGALCEQQRQRLLWCRASLNAISSLLPMSGTASTSLDSERQTLAALIPDLDQSIALLHPAALRLPMAATRSGAEMPMTLRPHKQR